MEIKRNGSQPSGQGPVEYFTGTVRIDPLFEPTEPARALGAGVTFEPGARTASSDSGSAFVLGREVRKIGDNIGCTSGSVIESTP